jgi:hypothetical protein
MFKRKDLDADTGSGRARDGGGNGVTGGQPSFSRGPSSNPSWLRETYHMVHMQIRNKAQTSHIWICTWAK